MGVLAGYAMTENEIEWHRFVHRPVRVRSEWILEVRNQVASNGKLAACSLVVKCASSSCFEWMQQKRSMAVKSQLLKSGGVIDSQ